MSRAQGLTSVIPATQEAEIRTLFLSQPEANSSAKTHFEKNTSQKRADGVAQDVGSEFKPQYHQKKKKEKEKS
jgi:hypothetical protein